MSHPGMLGPRARLALAGLALAVQVAAWLLWVEPGPLLIDEVTYHRMTRDLVAGEGLSLWNGYEELPAPELTSQYMQPSDGRLVSQYPYGTAVLAAPFYVAFGYMGLFLVNALAFVAVLALCYRLARRLGGDERVALGACALLALASFAWEYSMAAWPHISGLMFLLLACDAALSVHRGPAGGASMRYAAAAGLALGVAATLRLDAIFVLPLLLAPLALRVQDRWREAAAMVGGVLPGLAFLSATNLARWDNPSPFSYGRGGGLSELGQHLPALLAALLSVAALWVLGAPRRRSWLRANRAVLAAALVAVAGASLLFGPVREAAEKLLHGAYALLIDLRALPADQLGPAMSRSRDGSVLYNDGFKKALLQSMPYLPLLTIPALRMATDARRAGLLMLLGVPAVFAAFFSYFAWHGGLCLNMRYLIPALPFVAILSAHALRELGAGAGKQAIPALLGGFAFGLVLYAAGRAAAGPDLGALETLLMVGPLLLAAPLALTCAAWLLRPGRAIAFAALILSGTAIAWSASVAFEYDASWSRRLRSAHSEIAERVAAHVPPDSLLLAEFPDPFYGVIEHRDDVRVAVPQSDGFVGSERLIAHHAEAGRPIHGVLTEYWWQHLARSGALAHSRIERIESIGPYVLARIHPAAQGRIESPR